jgi:hypothetical protein
MRALEPLIANSTQQWLGELSAAAAAAINAAAHAGADVSQAVSAGSGLSHSEL